MLGHSPLATQPYGAGHQHLNATVNLSAFSPLALSLGTTGIEISKNVDAPSLLATLSTGTLLFEGDANVVLTNAVATYDTNTYDHASSTYSEASFIPTGQLQLGLISTSGTASLTLPSFALSLSDGLDAVTTVGTANVTLTTNVATLSLGTVSVEGTANLVLPTFELTTSFNQPSIIGTANVSISGFALQLTSPLDDVIITTINQDDYAKDRTVFVSYRGHNINSSNNVSSQLRTIVIPTRKHIVKATSIVDDQNRTIIIPPRSHIVRTTKIAA